jgi:anti-sigma-K factor RskA
MNTSSDDLSTCPSFADQLPELALGVLTGRDRARLLAHVDSCPSCADELERLARTADMVVQVAPEADPPLGFEVRLFERMGVAQPRRRRSNRHVPRWMPVAAAAAVVALGLGLGLGLSSGPSTSPVGSAQRGHSVPPVVSAALVGNGDHTVGHVVVFGGARPWMSMALSDSAAPAQGWVTCVVVTDSGKRETVGTFDAREGYAAWGGALHVDPSRLRSTEVLDSHGAVIASADLG